jgi:iron complex transport system substrate-binding protein
MKRALSCRLLLSAVVAGIFFSIFVSPVTGQEAGKRRIVSLAPSVTESLFALGFGEEVVGVTNYDLYPKNVAALPKVGGYYDPSLEKILSLEPDLVIGIKTFHSELLERLEDLGIQVLSLVVHRRFNDIRLAMDRLAEEFGQPQAAEEAWQNILNELARVRKKARRLFGEDPPSVMVVVWHDPLTIAGGYNYIDDILDRIGLPNAAGDIRYTFPVINREGLVVRNPAVLIVAAASTGMSFSEEDLRSVLRGLPIEAVTENRIVTVSADSLFHPGPRAAIAAEDLVDAVAQVTGGDARSDEEKIFD